MGRHEHSKQARSLASSQRRVERAARVSLFLPGGLHCTAQPAQMSHASSVLQKRNLAQQAACRGVANQSSAKRNELHLPAPISFAVQPPSRGRL